MPTWVQLVIAITAALLVLAVLVGVWLVRRHASGSGSDYDHGGDVTHD